MSGIPITFSEGLPPYTVIGETERLGRQGVTAVLLSPEPPLENAARDRADDAAQGRVDDERDETGRAAMYRRLSECGFDFVVSLEPADTRADIGGLAAAFPFVRFILLKERLNRGREINLAAAETREAFFLVLRRGYQMVPAPLAGVSPGDSPSGKPLCAVPLIYDRGGRALPVGIAPAFSGGKRRSFLRTTRAAPRGGEKTLFPFGGMGLYHRERFVRLGGFDGTIESEYWQLMDFGLRCYAWGEEILCDKTLKLISDRDIPPYHIDFDGNYRRFYLKNLSPVFRFDAAYLPLRRFPHFLAKS
ncbi:MAG: hypothetical protein LBD20_00995, partial [Spirochaetaceae bacterium]|nr:hypothetical protein [Spirochaetaceae bacterium]